MRKSFEDGAMWFLLPEEKITPEALLADPEALSFLSGNRFSWENQGRYLVNLSVPKFDVVLDLELSAQLQALGVTDVFDPNRSDFSPMTEELNEIYVSRVQHAARVLIDEESGTAAAYTFIETRNATAMAPPEELDFILNRPFLFILSGAEDLPLFVGIVNQPAA